MLTKKSNIIALITLLLVLLPSLLPASGGPRYRKGHVAAKGVIQSPDGNPYWVEYNDDGDVVKFIGEAAGDLADSTLMTGNDYRLHMAGFTEVETLHSAHRLILAREAYEARSFSNAAEEPIEKPALLPSTRYVVVRTSEVLYSPQDLILYQSPLNLDLAQNIPPDIRSVLVNQDGVVVHTAAVNIGYRVAFYSPLDYDPSEDLVDMSTAGNLHMGSFNPADNTLWGPIDGVLVESSLGRRGAPTNSDGRYSLTYYLPPCPGFAFFYDSIMMATLKYRSFNPNGKKLYTYYATAPDNDACSGYGDYASFGYTLGGLMAQMSVMPIDNSIEGSVTVRTKNFPIDMAMLSGEADLRNSLEEEKALPQSQKTVYGYKPIDFEPLVPKGDIDGDGQNDDHAELDEKTNQLSIWFDSLEPSGSPDLVRQADFNPDFTNQGLVKEVSDADLRNTDTFIYRVSNGQLFSARNGLLGNDVSNTTDTTINYRHIIRGPRKASVFQEDLEKWESRANVNEELRGWQADHIRTGEQLKVVMVNRATGYIGSSIATYGENTEKGGILSFTPEKIHMLPPNLKIRVERCTMLEKCTDKNRDKIYTIGFEGSGLTSDKFIVITTEWFDHDGSPLPEDLPGYTGRLAKVVDFDQLGQASGQIANFPIRPGHNQVVVKLPQKELDTAHYYVHVNGEAMEGLPDFSSEADFTATGAGEGLLQYRPKHYVPVRVPLYDKELTERAKKVRKQAIEDAIANGEDPDLSSVEPIYQWPYRPEMQFSLFDLTQVQYVDQQDTDGDNTYNLIRVDGNNQIVFGDGFNFLYEILQDELPMLEQFGPARELVFSIGQQELLVTLSEGLNPLDFSITNIDYSLVDPAELLALRLFQNGDDANILWEYAFYVITAVVDNNHDGEVTTSPDTADVSDKTEAIMPFKFWVNNDYDVVSDTGVVNTSITRCPNQDPTEQVCEQWDEIASQSLNNISSSNFTQIESERDLEDFAPLLVALQLPKTVEGYPELPEDMVFSMKAHNININLYRGVWETGTDYLTDTEIMQRQVLTEYDVDNDGNSEALYLFNLGESNQEKTFDQQALNSLFGKRGEVRLIFEGYKASPESCDVQPESCYLEVSLKRGSEIVVSTKVYVQIHDIKNYYDHYSVGKGELQDGATLLYQAQNLHETGVSQYPLYNIFEGKDEGFENEYIMFVHGWRMKYEERVSFGETAFKRLYWSGYKGRFGLFSWPTGWFNKPAHIYGGSQLKYVIGNQQNYGDSEALARMVGPKLSNLLAGFNGEKNLNIFAHSMGNVVVSEALRSAGGQQLVANYVASQAATVASGYNPLQPFIIHEDPVVGITFSGPESAWRFYNYDNHLLDTEYDMPPNHYTYTIPALHGATSPDYEPQVAQQENWGPAYYADIGLGAGRIVNFHNFRDAALTSWEVNQLTKPDFADGPTYEYNWDCSSCGLLDYPEFEDDDQVTDVYSRASLPLRWNLQLSLDQNSADILGHIISARTNALGQVEGTGNSSTISEAVNLNLEPFGFGDSNQGHSTQFYNNYVERREYWETLIYQFELSK